VANLDGLRTLLDRNHEKVNIFVDNCCDRGRDETQAEKEEARLVRASSFKEVICERTDARQAWWPRTGAWVARHPDIAAAPTWVILFRQGLATYGGHSGRL